jgi:DNA-binding GntR family transcriptional regulator
MQKKQLRQYITPYDRLQKISGYQLVLATEATVPSKKFFGVLFENPAIGAVLERTFEGYKEEQPVTLIKSFLPVKLLPSAPAANLEKQMDISQQVSRIKKEIVLTWPTDEEAQQLRLIGDSQVIVEKNWFYSKQHQIVRYEEEISHPEFYEFEE